MIEIFYTLIWHRGSLSDAVETKQNRAEAVTKCKMSCFVTVAFGSPTVHLSFCSIALLRMCVVAVLFLDLSDMCVFIVFPSFFLDFMVVLRHFSWGFPTLWKALLAYIVFH